MKKFMLLAASIVIFSSSYSQIGINNNNSQPDPSAMLDVQSNDKGLLIPRLTTLEMDQIASPATGLLVFNSDSVDIYMFNGNYWLNIRKNIHPIYPSTYFECGWDLDYEGQSYSTVQIGSQCWMSENLNIGDMITGTPTDNGVIEKVCYGNTASNCDIYGGLYTWDEMMQYSTGNPVRGICPQGWHVPSESEWCTMTTFVDPTVNCNVYAWNGTDIGYKLKSTSGWFNGWNGSDAVGYTGMPAGIRSPAGDYFDLTTYGYWWSTEPNGSNAWNRRISAYENTIGRFYNTKTYSLSVRCIKD
jgi:uncharacterized protein (TIGR02145 family)